MNFKPNKDKLYLFNREIEKREREREQSKIEREYI